MTPLLVEAIREGGFGARQIALNAARTQNESEALLELILVDATNDKTPGDERVRALRALQRLDDRFQNHWAAMRELALSADTPSSLQQTAADSVEVRPDDSAQFLDRYAREFAVPVILNAVELERSNVVDAFKERNREAVLWKAPDLVWPRLIKWSQSDDLRAHHVVQLLSRDQAVSLQKLIDRFKEGNEDESPSILELVRRLAQEDARRSFTARTNTERTSLIETAAAFLGEATMHDNPQVAAKAVNELSLLAISPRIQSYEHLALAELARRGIRTDDAWRKKYTRLYNDAER